MSPTTPTDDERDVLNEVRKYGALMVAPDTHAFDAALRMEAGGFLRAVRRVDPPTTTFVLSGRGIAIVGPGSSTHGAG